MTFTYEFRPFDGNKIAAFKELFCDTIFKVSNDMKLTPYAVLDLGKYRTPEELRYNITIDDIKNDLFRTKTIPVIPGQIGDRLYMHNFSDTRKTHLNFPKKPISLPNTSQTTTVT